MNTLSVATRIEVWDDGSGSSFITELFVDGECLVSRSQFYAIDFEALSQSAAAPGEYFIITCTCGIHECAGIYDGIEVTHQGNRIIWRIVEPEPERRFVFNASKYRIAVERGIVQARSLIESHRSELGKSCYITPRDNGYFLGIYSIETDNP